jgi:hypothetical protein
MVHRAQQAARKCSCSLTLAVFSGNYTNDAHSVYRPTISSNSATSAMSRRLSVHGGLSGCGSGRDSNDNTGIHSEGSNVFEEGLSKVLLAKSNGFGRFFSSFPSSGMAELAFYAAVSSTGKAAKARSLLAPGNKTSRWTRIVVSK